MTPTTPDLATARAELLDTVSAHMTRMARTNVIHCGDALAVLRTLPSGLAHTIVTSPPYYGLRNYNDTAGQLGLEDTPEAYVARLAAVFREARRVLRDDGTLWINLGSSYCSHYIESDEMVLRDDLTANERRYVLEELAKHETKS